METHKTFIKVGDVIIQEPVTALTNFLVAGICFYAYTTLKCVSTNGKLLRYYFLTMTLAMIYSGFFGHAFQLYVNFNWKIPGWIISMCSIALLERSTILHAKSILTRTQYHFFTTLNTIELSVLITIVIMTKNFKFVEGHAAYGLLGIVLIFEWFIYKRTKSETSRLFLVAVFFSAIAAIVHQWQVTPHVWFNHLDLSHLLMAISAYYFMCAGKKLGTSSTASYVYRLDHITKSIIL